MSRIPSFVLPPLALAGVLSACTPEPPVSGRALFAENCAGCHGSDATGGGPGASPGTTPPDLTRIAARRDGIWPMLEVMSIIDGYAKGTNPRAGMPAFSGFLDPPLVPFDTGNGVTVEAPRNLIALVEYLETIQSPPPTDYVP
ncbi:Cytochrome c [Roseivivax lentus]|uniref:Cytochrome c n=1 Tax=Roseivivax lentus TaxID=633194 RepID=A0A1N7P045_9RHOB|nr:cytochrome c [Roseivivax lentus]SIT03950.1 Cytochrome c [Roseivivax lentus]